ncbi:MAG: hypothetical protein K6G91_00670 [Kiritimatiellae bacterium]|nr:hypothetical protein [Kiritimatiellia bacterium]
MSKPFKNVKDKSLFRQTAESFGEKVGTVRRVMKAVRTAVAELSADHPAHFARFINSWRLSAAHVDALADALMQRPQLEIPEDAQMLMLSPYSLEALFFYHPLAGVLNYAEEFEFVETSKALASAWSKLCAVLQARPNVSAHDVELLQTAVGILNTRVTDVYQGAAHSEPDKAWSIAFEDAENAFERIAKGLAS